MKDDLIEDFLDSDFSAQTKEDEALTWRQYFKQMCLGHLPLLEINHPREDWYTIDPITNEQYPEGWIIQDLCFIEPSIITVDGLPLIEIEDYSMNDQVINWDLAAQTLKRVVEYLFESRA